ncbi:MAG TPA: ABC transporter ATP-binding protein [Castellaniella sp.]|nr:ABC transporter ATP-binding protein [Castellaniella sp.]
MFLETRQVVKSFQGFKAVDALSVSVTEGEILGLIGPNGAGKSTFFSCLTGDLQPTSGEILFDGKVITHLAPEYRARLGLARSFQVPLTFEHMTVLENVMVGAFLHTRDVRAARAKARQVVDQVGLGPMADTPARGLGTPNRKRLEIARALATNPRILLLDEAMAGLTPTEVKSAIELVRALHAQGITLIIVEHVMEVIMSLTHRVVVMHQGRQIAMGTPREVVNDPQVVSAYLGKRAARAAAGTS